MKKANNERGAALLFALVVIVILGAGTTVLWKQLHSNLRQHRAAWHGEQAFQLAEAGLDTALANLRASGGGYVGEADVPLGAGTFSVAVTPGDGPGDYIIESKGRMANAAYRHDTVTLAATAKLAGDGQIVYVAWQHQKWRDNP